MDEFAHKLNAFLSDRRLYDFFVFLTSDFIRFLQVFKNPFAFLLPIYRQCHQKKKEKKNFKAKI